jgi:hypothetical protein
MVHGPRELSPPFLRRLAPVEGVQVLTAHPGSATTINEGPEAFKMEKYTVHQQAVGTILSWVESGQVAIPEIQRPFVWNSTKVRDLIDSLYHGYPALHYGSCGPVGLAL